MIACPRCRAENPPNNRFCTSCGSPLSVNRPNQSVGSPTPSPGFGIGLGVVLAVLILLVAGFFAYRGTTTAPAGGRPPTVPTPSPEIRGIPALRVLFARGLDSYGRPVGASSTFSRTDPQIVQIIYWEPSALPMGTLLGWAWYVNNQPQYVNGILVGGQPFALDAITAPPGGFPRLVVEVQVMANQQMVAQSRFQIR